MCSYVEMIRIHQVGSDLSVRPSKEAKIYMAQSAPYAYNAAQSIITFARKCAKKPGLFSNPVSHLPALDEACIALITAIEHHGLEGVNGEMTPSEFMSVFSDAHPNWQKEYDYLNRNSPYFSDKTDCLPTSEKQNWGEMCTLNCPTCGGMFQIARNAITKNEQQCSNCVLERWRAERA